ncbi:MAG: hypothetical protein IPJ13_26160 [Saprospiraceae bacterium]|nr:hypothetical protein [Saprospiraceae bacterium]
MKRFICSIYLRKRSQILLRLEQLNVERNAIEIKKEAFHPQEIKLQKHQSLDVCRSELTLQFSEEKRLKKNPKMNSQRCRKKLKGMKPDCRKLWIKCQLLSGRH